jgi:hypothetical protein
MADDVINHVQNDLRPKRVLTLADENDVPVDLTVGGISSIQMHMREKGDDVLKATVPCTMLSGIVQADGTVSYAAPYDVGGKGGRIQIEWTAESVDTAGTFEGEFELVYGDGTTQTTYKTTTITIRDDIG